MKPPLLVNENFPAPSTAKLRAAGWDVLAIADRHASLPDEGVLALACTEGRWLVTFDRDYGELIFGRQLPAPPAAILIREPHYKNHEPAEWLMQLLDEPSNCLGHFVVMTRESVRKRPLLRVLGGRS